MTMKLRLLRNATLKLEILSKAVLIDPFFAPKGSRPSFIGRASNPLVELPASPKEILDGVELVIVSHLHADHFDPVAQSLVPKHLPLICQPGDEEKICSYGFSDVTIGTAFGFRGVRAVTASGRSCRKWDR
jgi:L-ascorbate metabolism protein UlaG (beta-lactamase superfamily)